MNDATDRLKCLLGRELDGLTGEARTAGSPKGQDQERRHRVPANDWLGSAIVDNFALIGEKHGHLIAEEVLLLVARVMNNTFRTYDRIYRFGGEHFGVLMHWPGRGPGAGCL